MAYSVVISRKAQLDVDEAIDWYENQVKDLGIEFLLEFYSYSDFACQSPKLFGKVYKDYRKILLKKFPYAIYYVINLQRKEIVIVAVWHTKRNVNRLKGDRLK